MTKRRGRTLPAARTATETPGESGADGGFPIVGIGASAGGLEAFSALLKHLPLDTGMGFVLVQHLDPEHDSALVQLLGRATSLPVDEVENNLRVEPNHVYVIPPNTTLSITAGVLILDARPKTRTPNRSIDLFLEALAADQRERAIGVILSGTASDGTLGLEAIKGEGGITFAQDDSARYDSMPRSAVAAGCVDFVLSPEAIANELARIARHPAVAAKGPRASNPEDDRASAVAHEDDDTALPSGGASAPHTDAARVRAEADGEPTDGSAGTQSEDSYKKILLLLHTHSGVDFSLYKSTTIQRRITRRMVLGKQDSLDRYAEFLRGNVKELDALYSDTLISVTSFFRNPEAFDAMHRLVWPTLLERSDDPIRVWVLGCSTGQEAYSIAMAFVEAADNATRMHKVQVFATDLNETLLGKARYGLYAKSVAQDLSPERLRRFFVEEEGGYRVTKALREMVVFARQNVISDPPFSRLDIISCRNLLIYFEPGLQQKAVPIFHYALRPGGFLFLGASESVGAFTDLFESVDKKHKIYARKAGPSPALQLFASRERRDSPARSPAISANRVMHADERDAIEMFRAERTAEREADRLAAYQFAPPGVLINAELQILQFRGATSAYLTPPAGRATFDVLKMARPGLMLPLRTAINKAKRDKATARKEKVRIEDDGATRLVNLEVIPLKNLSDRCFLVMFEEIGSAGRQRPPAPPPRASTVPRGMQSRRIAELEAELAETRDYARFIQEQHEAAREELQASNEEVQSANEELQSVNEELETSKEELESANEELTTLNDEMSTRNAELNRLNSDLVNVQTSANQAIVLLGRDLRIRRFSAQAEKLWNLHASDIGRPFSHVRHQLQVTDLDACMGDVIESVRADEREVQDQDGHWFLLRVRPYLSLDNRVDGAVLVLVDIDALKQSEQANAAARDYADAIIRTVRDPLLVLNGDLSVNTANAAFYRVFDVSPLESEGRLVYELGNRQWDIPRLRELLDNILLGQSAFDDFEVTHDFEHLGRRTMVLNARRLNDAAGQPARILLGIQDITEIKAAAAARRVIERRFRALFTSIDEGFCILERVEAQAGEPLDFRYVEANPAFAKESGVEDVVGKTIRHAFPGEAEEWFNTYDAILRTGEPIRFERALATQGRILELYAFRVDDGTQSRVAVIFKDITARKEDEARRGRLSALVASSDDAIVSKDLNGIITSWNHGAERLFGYTAEEAVGQPVTMLIPADRLDEEPSFIASIRQGKSVEHYETVRRRKDGSFLDVSLTVSPILDDDGRVVGASKIARDITERKKTAEMLLAADRHKNEFLAMLAHELRNPLAPILVSIEILRRAQGIDSSSPRAEGPNVVSPFSGNDGGDRVNHALDVLQRQTGQMVRLVEDLLDAGRVTSGKIELRREKVELSSVVFQVQEAIRPFSESRQQELTVTLLPEPVYVDADPTRLAQIIGNLLNNACKFTDPGGQIWLAVEPVEASTNRTADGPSTQQVAIRLRDTGIGIAADQLDHIFDMFSQVDTSLERSLSGLGIGLTLVKTLTEMHGGTVEVNSAGVGQGTEFVVRLPIMTETDAAGHRHRTTEPMAATPLRILIVDDNRDSADMLATLLNFSGHETHTAHDGLAAVESATRLDPDVILMDIGLPVLNGYEAARRIRDLGRNGRRPILVALTGWGQDEDRRRSEEAGFDAHLVKPVDEATLSELLGSLGAGKQKINR